MAEAISSAINAPSFDTASADPAVVENYDLIILGTPVEGFRPAKETLAFIERLPSTSGKKAILFCTYKVFKGSTFRTMSKALAAKGYKSDLAVSEKKVIIGETDFSDEIEKIKKAI
jgi:flavodoxin